MGSPLCVLLVDDAKFFLELERQFLKNTPATLLSAESGSEALEVAKEFRPSLVFMDVDMPGMDGLECCRAFKADSFLNEIPVVLIGDQGRGPGEDAAIKAGADAYLEKPIDRRAFLGTGHSFLVSIDRRETRQTCHVAVEFLCLGRRFEGDCIDLSSGGMFLSCEPVARKGDSLKLKFVLPGDEAPLSIEGRIAWVNSQEQVIKPNYPYGYGVEFVGIDEEVGIVLRKFFHI